MSDPTEPKSQPDPPSLPVQGSEHQQPTARQQPAANYQNPPYTEQTPGIPVTLVKERTNGLAVTALILGAIAFVLAFIPFANFFGAFLALVGLVLGAVAIFQQRASKPLAITGTALSFIAGILAIIMIVVYTAAFVTAVNDSASNPVASSATGSSDVPSAAPADLNFTFGQTVTYEDGLAVTVSAPAAFTPSQYAAGATQKSNIVFTITIKNGTGKNYDPTMYTTVSSAGTEADAIFDTEANIGGAPTTTVPDGGTVTYRAAFSVADPAHLVMDVEPGFSYSKATFTN
jgi:hypothetical protein